MNDTREIRLLRFVAIALLLLGTYFTWRIVAKEPRAYASSRVATTAVSSNAPVPRRIDQIRLGDAVLSENPTGEEDLTFGREVNPATWKELHLLAPKKDGTYCEVGLLRPNWWVEQNRAVVGGIIHIAVPECGIDGDSEVLSIAPCPVIQKPKPGYRTVIGTFRHQAAKIIELTIEGVDKPIGTTPNHPFWSVDRMEFVRADELYIGSQVRGLSHDYVIKSKREIQKHESVANIEVFNSHVYRVSPKGLLVHNQGTPCPHGTQPRPRPTDWQAHHIIQDARANDLTGYGYYDAPSDFINGGSHIPGSAHDLANRMQTQINSTLRDKGVTAISYLQARSAAIAEMRAAGLTPAEIAANLTAADDYFINTLKIDPTKRIFRVP